MIFGVDDSEAARIERRLRDDRLAFAEAKRNLVEHSRRALTRPSTLALLLVVGGLAGARSKAPPPPPERRRAASRLALLLSAVWAPLVKGLTSMAVQRALHGRYDEAVPAARETPGRPYTTPGR